MPVAQAMILTRKFPASTGTIAKTKAVEISGTTASSSHGIVSPQFSSLVVPKYY